MPNRRDMFEYLWNAYRKSAGEPPLPFIEGQAIPDAWMTRYTEWGSPITDAAEIGGDYIVQTFTRAVVSWHPTNGISVEVGK